ncbi:hypothetical protein [Amycolatopsis keratiniphila]|uniref:hypothetical protein n=1 Tax=Amycolatopsis keratiniphila TaxID=129921 RepID=UPI000879CEA8|nr:hypothetical protein [Amycolatopsis keratiniphila]SDU67361.1 hypothetical protein SAMN04489733_8110 [Amycolatopsis keratiniphila]
MNWAIFSGPLGVAAFGVGGVVIGSLLTHLFTGRRDKRAHKRELYSKLVDKVYELYPEYHKTLSRNVEVLSGIMEMPEEKILELRDHVAALEQEMQVFASRDVLDAFDIWRSIIATIAMMSGIQNIKGEAASILEKAPPDLELDLDLTSLFRVNLPETLEKLLEASSAASSLALAAVRVDLRIDTYKSRFALRQSRRRVKKLMASRSSDAADRAHQHIRQDRVRARTQADGL